MENLLSRDVLNYSIEGCFVGDVVNFNGIIAVKTMREVLAKDDTYALAMNSLPPRYIQVTSEDKYTHSKDYINDTTIRDSVIQVMEKVRAEPNH